MTTDTLPVPATQRLTAAECRLVMLGVYAAHHEREVWVCEDHGEYDPLIGLPEGQKPCRQICREFGEYEHRSVPCVEAALDDLLTAEFQLADRARKATRRAMEVQARQDRDDDLRARGEV